MADASSPVEHPSWISDIDRLLALRSQFILSGNIRDLYLSAAVDGQNSYEPLIQCLWNYFQSKNFCFLFVYEPDRLQVFPPREEHYQQAEKWYGWKNDSDKGGMRRKLSTLAGDIRRIADGPLVRQRVGIVIDYASRLIVSPGTLTAEEFQFFVACEQSALASRSFLVPHSQDNRAVYNPVIWLANRRADLPAWLTADNERIYAVEIPRPSQDDRAHLAKKLVNELSREDGITAEQITAAERGLVRGTEGMTLTAMHDIVELANDQHYGLAKIEEAIRCYRLGTPENPWDDKVRQDAIRTARSQLENRVKGQEQAVTKVVDILMRTAVGLTGAHTSSTNTRPRGVLFFAGPTGVGKTELAKALTEILFGSDDHYIRFDMSEFSAEHASDRLIGAPPGYVGFDAGGELTNAMRRQPCSVVLFDEIEKAHPRLLDKFLQILDDGRLTDGRGDTAYFTDAILIFTSNLGIYRIDARGTPLLDDAGRRVPTVERGEPYSTVESRVRDAIRDYFIHRLGRPELLNRLGDNIVVFNFISDEVALLIMDAMLARVAHRLSKSRGIALQIGESAREQLVGLCRENLDHGGRGIGNRLETTLVNPLARRIFEDDLRDSVLRVESITESSGVYSLQCTR